MSWSYADIETGIAAAIGPAVTGSPIKTVHTGVSHLSDIELITFMKTLANANDAPAAVIFYGGGVAAEAHISNVEDGTVQVVIVLASTSRSVAGSGVLTTMSWVRDKLHDVAGISGIPIPLRWKRNDRFRLPEVPQEVAAFVMTFSGLINYKAT